MKRPNNRPTNTMSLILCLTLSSLCVMSQSASVHGKNFATNRAVKSSSPFVVLSPDDNVVSMSEQNGYRSALREAFDKSSRDYDDNGEDVFSNEKRRLRFHKRRLRFDRRDQDEGNFRRIPTNAVSMSADENSPFDLSNEDGAVYQRDLRAPRLRFYSLRKRAAGEMEQSEGQNPETESHSRRKRSVLTPSLSSLGESLESGISKRISINQDLKAITDMLLTEQIRERQRYLADLRPRLLEKGKRSSGVSLLTSNKDEEQRELLKAISNLLD
nr:egg-laying hormone [Aplysia californica]